MKNYPGMWKLLRQAVALRQQGTIERMMAGTAQDFDRRKGEWGAYEEIKLAMRAFEQQDFEGTLPELEEQEENDYATRH